MVTEELIKNQEEASTLVDAKYTVVVSGAGTTCEEKPVLEALLPGIRLHFLRYGLFVKDAVSDVGYNIKGSSNDEGFTTKEMDASNNGLDSTDIFYVAKTSLNNGYLYLFNDDNVNDYHELSINQEGKITPILWKKSNLREDGKTPKNTRTSKEKNIRYKLVVNKEKDKPKKYWIGYSPVQWSYEDHKKMLNASEEDKKKANLILVTCGGIKNGEETAQEHVSTYKDVKFVHYKGHPNHEALKSTIRQVNKQEAKENESGNNSVYEDMFITLHDPISCAEDIATILDHSLVEQQAIINALQTGEDYSSTLQRLENGKDKISFSEKEQQIQALFQTALTTYHLVYSNQKMIDDYDGGAVGYWNTDFKGSGIRKGKILNILGVEKRKEHRKKIRTFQDELGYFMSADYYQKAWCHYNSDMDDSILEGKYRCTKHMSLLSQKPHDADRHLDLKNDYEDSTKKWEGFFADTLEINEENPFTILLDAPIEVAFLSAPIVDLENKIGGVIRGLTESYASLTINKTGLVTQTRKVPIWKVRETVTYKTVTTQSYQDVLFRRLRTHKVYGVEVLELQTKEIEAHFKGSKFELNNSKLKNVTYKGGKPIARFAVGEEIVLKQKLRGENLIQVPVKSTEIVSQTSVVHYLDEIEKQFQVPTTKKVSVKNTELAKKLFDGKIFTGSLAILQVFNTLNAVNGLSQDVSLKNLVNLAGISSELTEASLHFKRSIALSKKASEKTISKLYSKASLYGNIGAGITVLMCSWEAFDSANARDYDAAWAWAGAGASWAAFSFGGTTISGGLAALGFTPVGLVVAGMAIGLTALAYYLKDTPLEALFKNNVLSDAVAFPLLSNEEPWEYTTRLYGERDNQILPPTSSFFQKDAFRKWTDFKIGYQDLMDVLVCASIHFEPTKLVHRGTLKPWTSTMSVSITTSDIVSYRAEVSFRQFLTTEDQLQYEVYYFENGLDQTPACIDLVEQKVTIDKAEGQIPKAIIDFTVNKNKLTNNNRAAHIVFVCRLKIEESNYYPIDISGEERYIGAKFTTQEEVREIQKGLFNKKVIKDSEFQAPVAIDTLTNLLSKKAWKK